MTIQKLCDYLRSNVSIRIATGDERDDADAIALKDGVIGLGMAATALLTIRNAACQEAARDLANLSSALREYYQESFGEEP